LYTERACLGSEAVIDQRKCTKCDKCFEACRFGAIDFDKQADRYSVNALNCEGCGLCIEICPAKAISEKRAETGSLMLSESTRGQLVHAKLAPAAENSGKLVSMVRSLAFAIVDQQQKEWLLRSPVLIVSYWSPNRQSRPCMILKELSSWFAISA
jgi:MinD superfamily P-loop ATPase